MTNDGVVIIVLLSIFRKSEEREKGVDKDRGNEGRKRYFPLYYSIMVQSGLSPWWSGVVGPTSSCQTASF